MSCGGPIHAVGQDGVQDWVFQGLYGPASVGFGVETPVVVYQDAIYAGVIDWGIPVLKWPTGWVYAISTDGPYLGRTQAKDHFECGSEAIEIVVGLLENRVIAGPTVDHRGLLYVGLSGVEGDRLAMIGSCPEPSIPATPWMAPWNIDIPFGSTLTFVATAPGDTVLYGTGRTPLGGLIGAEHGIYALDVSDPMNPVPKWPSPVPIASAEPPLVLTDGSIYAGGGDGVLYAIAPDGAIQWTFETGGAILSTPVFSDGVVYFGSQDGCAYAVDALTGGEVYAPFVTTDWLGSPIVGLSNETVYFAGWDGRLYALRPSQEVASAIFGIVHDLGGQPISGATVTAMGGGSSYGAATTDGQGFYMLEVPPGTYDVTAAKRGYLSETLPNVAALDGLPGRHIDFDLAAAVDVEPPDTVILGGMSIEFDGGQSYATAQWAGCDDLTTADGLVYSYWLEGYDAGWSAWTSDTHRVYTGIPFKDYTFHVKSKDESGQEDPTPASASFTLLGAIGGYVKDASSSDPIEAIIDIYTPGGALYQGDIAADSSGTFAVDSVPPGEYYLMVRADGYIPQRWPDAGYLDVGPAEVYGVGTVSLAEVQPPQVARVLVSSTGWDTTFLAPLGEEGYAIPTGSGQLGTLPWTSIDQVKIAFTEDVNVSQGDLSVHGVNVPDYAITGFGYDPGSRTATWTFSAPITADKLLLALSDDVTDTAGNRLDGEWSDGSSTFPSGNGAEGGDFQFRLNVLPGDCDQSAEVRTPDWRAARAQLGAVPGDAGYSVFLDVDGSGDIRTPDWRSVRSHLGDELPAGEPTAPLGAMAMIAAMSGAVETDADVGIPTGQVKADPPPRILTQAVGPRGIGPLGSSPQDVPGVSAGMLPRLTAVDDGIAAQTSRPDQAGVPLPDVRAPFTTDLSAQMLVAMDMPAAPPASESSPGAKGLEDSDLAVDLLRGLRPLDFDMLTVL